MRTTTKDDKGEQRMARFGTDKHGVRFFCDHNGSRVDYPTGTKFSDGYVQPQIVVLRDAERTAKGD